MPRVDIQIENVPESIGAQVTAMINKYAAGSRDRIIKITTTPAANAPEEPAPKPGT
jgi:hypothetical protein